MAHITQSTGDVHDAHGGLLVRLLAGRTMLIIHNDVDSAIPLQDRIVRAGGRVLTAYSLSRALLIAQNARLDDALIGYEVTGASEIANTLRERRVPYIFCATGSQDGHGASPSDVGTAAIARSS